MDTEVSRKPTSDRESTGVHHVLEDRHPYETCSEYLSTGRSCAECRHNQACDEADAAYDYAKENPPVGRRL